MPGDVERDGDRTCNNEAGQEIVAQARCRVQLIGGKRDNVFLVPQTAVIQTEKSFLVFTLDKDNKAASRPVQVGDWVGSDWMILSGLNPGDRVILDNLLKLRPGASVNPQPPAEAKAATAPAAK